MHDTYSEIYMIFYEFVIINTMSYQTIKEKNRVEI